MNSIDPADIPDRLESGALAARSGFNFQDEVALVCCLDMCLDSDTLEIRCESLDDVALVRTDHVEYLQVKNFNLGQLWSVAKLTERDGRAPGTSLLEKSLGRAVPGYPSLFTIATSVGVNRELKPLTNELGAELRNDADVAALASRLAERLSDSARGPDGTTVEDWVMRAYWIEVGSPDVVHLRAGDKLRRLAEKMRLDLTSQDADRVHSALLQHVRKAADSPVPSEKRFTRSDFRKLIEEETELTRADLQSGYAARARLKMEEASIDVTAISNAVDQRRCYREELLTPRYTDAGALRLVASDVQAHMSILRANRVGSSVDISGPEFHRACIEKVVEIVAAYPDVPLNLALGSLYDLTNRCLHRFD